MGSFIDRDPERMIAYGKGAKEIIGEMLRYMKATEGKLDQYASELDSKSQAEIMKLHESIATYMREIALYNDVADEIKKKGLSLKEARERSLI